MSHLPHTSSDFILVCSSCPGVCAADQQAAILALAVVTSITHCIGLLKLYYHNGTQLPETETDKLTQTPRKGNNGVYLKLNPSAKSFTKLEPPADTCSIVRQLYMFVGLLIKGMLLPRQIIDLGTGGILLLIGMALAGKWYLLCFGWPGGLLNPHSGCI